MNVTKGAKWMSQETLNVPSNNMPNITAKVNCISCGKEHTIELKPYYGYRHKMIFCDPEDGGCDFTFVVKCSARPVVTIKTYQLKEVLINAKKEKDV